MGPRLTDEQRDNIYALRDKGLSYDQIAEQVGCSNGTAWQVVNSPAIPRSVPCKVCKEPTRSTIGFCKRTNECLRARQAAYKARNRGVEYEYKPRRYCVGCGGDVRGDNTNQYCKSNPECRRNHDVEYRIKTKVQNVLAGARGRAKRNGFPFDLTIDDIPPIPEFCPVLNIPLKVNVGAGFASPNSPSLDKIIPALGYVKGNVQWISNRANVMKNDASPDELVTFAKWVLQEYELERKAV